jgi:pyridoxamine 5'-phosphate oxidase
MDISKMRKDYKMETLREGDVKADPLDQFRLWFEEALKAEVPEPNAMTLATCSANAKPSARIVLLKGVIESGFIFFTNYDSRKGIEIASNPLASLVFLWHELERQVRVDGAIEKISREESASYFYSRPFQSQVSALVSPQSKVIQGKDALEQLHAEKTALYSNNTVPFPENWGGYLVKPEVIEFWQGRSSRFHDRICYKREFGNWKIERLAP